MDVYCDVHTLDVLTYFGIYGKRGTHDSYTMVQIKRKWGSVLKFTGVGNLPLVNRVIEKRPGEKRVNPSSPREVVWKTTTKSQFYCEVTLAHDQKHM